MDPTYNPWATPLFPNHAAFGTGSPAEDAQRQPNLLDNLLSRIAGAAGRMFIAPGQALQSTTPITTEQMIRPAADIAGSMTLGAGAIPADLNALRMGIKAYHGSPHDFDRFDISKIGTGEGAQAYGHGLYFAENEGVARSYRDTLSRTQKGETLVNGQPLEALPPELQSKAFTYWNTGDKSLIAGTPLETAKFEVKPPGRMYEVNLNADPAHFLDWDKPIKQQPEVLKKIQDANVILPFLRDTFEKNAASGISGSNAYKSYIGSGDVGASQLLRDHAGIPGIRYLDQGSRGAGEGSSNYVMFNDKLIDILRKYGIAGITAPPIFANAMSEQKQ